MNFKLSKYIVFSEPTLRNKYRVVYSTRSANVLLLSTLVVDKLLSNKYLEINDEILNQLITYEMLIPSEENELRTIIENNEAAVEDNKSLYYVLQPTASCQMGCGYCGQAHSKDRLSEKLYPRILQRIEGKLFMNPDYENLDVAWFGSEPLMAYKHIQNLSPMLMDLAKKYNCKYAATMVTNGLSLKKNVFQNLAKLGLKKFEVTLDGTAEYHDKRRHTKSGEKTFDIIFQNLKDIFSLPNYEDYGVQITIRCNVDSTNHQGVEDLINLLAEHNLQHKIAKFYVAPIHAWGNDAHKISLEKQAFATREIEWYLMLIEKGFPISVVPNQTKPIVCMAVKPDAEIIDAFGNVYNCTETPYVPAYEKSDYLMGNIRFPDETIGEKNDPLVTWNQDLLNKKFPCSDCRILPICGGACPKQWHEEISPCPSIKYNIEQRMLIYTKQVLANKDAQLV